MSSRQEYASCFDCGRFSVRPPATRTPSTLEQQAVERSCLELYKPYMDAAGPGVARADVLFMRELHERYLRKGLEELSAGYASLDASRPWLCYWIVHSLALLGKPVEGELASRVVGFLRRCQDPTGGYCGGPHPGQLPHLAPTYAAVNALVTLGTEEALASLDRVALRRFLLARKGADGSFTMHEDGEVDIRGAYTAISVATLLNMLGPDLVQGTAEWIARCQTFEGGLGGEPGLEAHGGYTFCGTAALALLGRLDALDLGRLLPWLASCQKNLEGGFHGRTNKLVDGCYSFWQGATFPVLTRHGGPALDPLNAKADGRWKALVDADGPWCFDQTALEDYLMICSQVSGGLRDKPGKPQDYYHTCYCLSGLSVAQDGTGEEVADGANDAPEASSSYGMSTRLERIDPRFNLVAAKVTRALAFFQVLV